jgi:hypothetical protein
VFLGVSFPFPLVFCAVGVAGTIGFVVSVCGFLMDRTRVLMVGGEGETWFAG